MAPGASLVRTNRLSVRSVRGQPGVGGVRRGGADPWDRADLKPGTVRRGGGEMLQDVTESRPGADLRGLHIPRARSSPHSSSSSSSPPPPSSSSSSSSSPGTVSDPTGTLHGFVNLWVELCGCRRLVVFISRFVLCACCVLFPEKLR